MTNLQKKKKMIFERTFLQRNFILSQYNMIAMVWKKKN